MKARFTLDLFFSLILGILVSTPVFSKTKTLADIRPSLVYPDYTDDEKQILADQAYLIADQMYVHRELKTKAFGAAIDPVERLLVIKQTAKSMTPEQLNDAISRVFQDQRDLHFNFYRPAPISNWALWLPASFAFVTVGNTPRVVVATVSNSIKAEVPALAQVHMGDRLLSYDGMDVEDALKAAGELGGGANDDAWRSRAIERLSVRSISQQAIPTEDTIALSFERHNGEQYTVELPWLAYKLAATSGGASMADSAEKSAEFTDATNDFQVLFNKLFRRYPISHTPSPGLHGLNNVDETADKTIFKGIVTTSSGRFGFLRLDSFVPSLSTAGAIALIRSILLQDFADTDGLIIDVRDNGGGIVMYADMLVQLFSPQNVQPGQMRILATPLNELVFNVGNLGAKTVWSKAIQDARTLNHPFSQPLNITSDNLANYLGQSWFKSVAILTNANCYSACDLFAASMQDHEAAVIIGEDHTTGAGGANVMKHSQFLKIMDDKNEVTDLEALPFGQEIRVSWRQAIRSGKHAGELIENAGVASDIIIPRVEQDLYHDEAFLMERVGAALAPLSSLHKASIGIVGSELLFENGKDAQWQENAQGTDIVEIRSHNSILAKIDAASGKHTEISIPGSSSTWTRGRYELIGYTEGRRVWRVWRDVRWVGEYLKVDSATPLTADFSGTMPTFIQTENMMSVATSGWQVRDGALTVGKGPAYENDVFTTAFIPLNAKDLKKLTIKFDLTLHSEKAYDHLRVYARAPSTNQREELLSLSGDKSGPQTATIKKLTGNENLEIVLEFQSDGNVVGSGPVIDNLEITGVPSVPAVNPFQFLTDLVSKSAP